MAKQVDFFDGAQSSTTPTIGNVDTTNLACYANDAAYEAANVGAPAQGNVYCNTTDNVIRYYNGTTWTTLADDGSVQTFTNKILDGTSATGTNTISIDADDASYDNTTSGLTATNAQAAIDEVEGRLDTAETDITTAQGSADANTTDIADLRTTTGTADGATDMGTFTGSTLTDNTDLRTLLQEIEDAVEAVGGALVFAGTWDANANSPALADGVGTQGEFYIVSTAGTTSLDGIASWAVNDWAIFDGTVWRKIDNSELVTSVNGQTGNAVLDLDDLNDVNMTGVQIRNILRRNVSNNGYEDFDPRQVQTDSATGSNVQLSNPSDKVLVKLTNASLVSVDMIPATYDGQELIIANQTGNPITFNDNTGATAANRIRTGTGGPLVLKNNASIKLIYDSSGATDRWLIVGGTGSGDGATSGIITGDNSTADTTAGDWVAYSDAAAGSVVASQTVNDGSTSILSPSSTANDWRAQQFQPSSSGTMSTLRLMLNDAGGITAGEVTIEIQNDVANEPGGTVLGSFTVDLTTIVNTPDSTFYDYAVTGGPSLVSGTDYWFVIRLTTLITGTGSLASEYKLGGGDPTLYKISSDGGSTWGSDIPAVDLAYEVVTSGAGEAIPDNGVGGSPNITVDRTDTALEILQGSGSYKLVKGAFNRQGEGASLDIEVPAYIRGQASKISFSYSATADFNFGSPSDPVGNPSDIQVFLYDVTNSKIINVNQPYIYGGGLYEAAVQIPSDCEDVRVILHIATTNALAYDFIFDRVQLDLSPNEFLKSDSDWIPYTPTFTGFGTALNVDFRYRVQGSDILIRGRFEGGTPTATEARISLPEGYTSKSEMNALELVGVGLYGPVGEFTWATLMEPDKTYMTVGLQSVSFGGYNKANGNEVLGAGSTVSFTARIPIQGLTAGVAHPAAIGLNAQAVMRAYKTSGSISAATIIPSWTTVVSDSVGGFDATTGVYTVKSPGDYAVTGTLYQTANNTNIISIYLNGTRIQLGSTNSSQVLKGVQAVLPNLKYGDTIDLRSNTAETIQNDVAGTSLNIFKIGSEQQPYAPRVAYLKDVHPNGTLSGQFTAGAWTARNLNTVEGDESFISLSANKFTLQPGTYHIEASAPAFSVQRHQTKIRNTTDASDAIVGEAAFAETGGGVSPTRSSLFGTISISSAKDFELQHYCQTTRITNGLGVNGPAGNGVDTIFATAKITKVL